METPIMLTDKEREFLISILIKLPIQVTLETLHNNKTVDEMVTLVKKLHGGALNSDGADATITEEG